MVLFHSPPSLPKAKEFGPLECMQPHLTTIYIFNCFILNIGKRFTFILKLKFCTWGVSNLFLKLWWANQRGLNFIVRGAGRKEGGTFKLEPNSLLQYLFRFNKNNIIFKCQFFKKLRSLCAEIFLNYCLLKPKFVYQNLVWVWQCNPAENCTVLFVGFFKLFFFLILCMQ
jgi:hypothetical protein